jgi:MoaA/NifB/PqqE/SkfB family radical SAM enzyme
VDGVEDVHDEVRGIDGFFGRVQKTLEGLEALQTTYPILSVRLSTVVLPQNIDNVPAVREYAAQHLLPIHFSPVVISGGYYENKDESIDLVAKPSNGQSSVVHLFTNLAEEELSSLQFHYRDIANMFQGAERSRRCMMGHYDFVLEYNGDVYACVNCETYSFGNLFETSFEEIWFGSRAIKARQQVQKNCCPTCPSPCHAPPVDAGELLKIRWQGLQRRFDALTSRFR